MKEIKLSPNDVTRIKAVLEAVSKKQDIKTRVKFAKILKQCDEELEVFQKSFDAPDMSLYESSLKTVHSEEMKGKPEEKIKMLESINKKYSKELKTLEEHNKTFSKAAAERYPMSVGTITISDLPEDISSTQLSYLLLILED